MEDDGRPLLLKWSRTFPDIPDREDFSGRLASDPAMFARADPVTDASPARDLLAAKMTTAQIADAQRMAREWKPTAP